LQFIQVKLNSRRQASHIYKQTGKRMNEFVGTACYSPNFINLPNSFLLLLLGPSSESGLSSENSGGCDTLLGAVDMLAGAVDMLALASHIAGDSSEFPGTASSLEVARLEPSALSVNVISTSSTRESSVLPISGSPLSRHRRGKRKLWPNNSAPCGARARGLPIPCDHSLGNVAGRRTCTLLVLVSVPEGLASPGHRPESNGWSGACLLTFIVSACERIKPRIHEG